MAQRQNVVSERLGDVAILRLSRPPSNALSPSICAELSGLLAGVMQDSALIGAVITSDLRVFSAGSDVADLLDAPKGHRAELRALCQQIAIAPKPVVVAIAGACLSTGLDLALAAQGRVAGPQASFGYPDMRLGLLPAAGGAVRLTHLIGAEMALEMLLQGNATSVEAALDLGLVDQICAAGAEVAQAAQMVRDLQGKAAPPHAADMSAEIAAIAAARANLPPKDGPWIAHARLVDVVEGARLLPLDMALAAEYAAHDEVQSGPISRALCYAFVTRQRSASEGGDGRKDIQEALRRTMADVVAHFESLSLPRADVLGAMAAFGIGVPQGAALPACPKRAEGVMPALLAAWANLGARLLRTGAALRGDEIDMAAISAGMCPNWQGGPIYAADLRGPLIMRTDLRALAKTKGGAALFTPDPAWDEIVANGLRLAEYSAPDRV